jgi:hypothetical protein
MSKVEGTCYIKSNGVTYPTSFLDDYKIQIGKVKRKHIPASDGEIYYSEWPLPDRFTGTILITQELTYSVIGKIESAKIQFHFSDGRTALLVEAFTEKVKYSGTGAVNVSLVGKGKWL